MTSAEEDDRIFHNFRLLEDAMNMQVSSETPRTRVDCIISVARAIPFPLRTRVGAHLLESLLEACSQHAACRTRDWIDAQLACLRAFMLLHVRGPKDKLGALAKTLICGEMRIPELAAVACWLYNDTETAIVALQRFAASEAVVLQACRVLWWARHTDLAGDATLLLPALIAAIETHAGGSTCLVKLWSDIICCLLKRQPDAHCAVIDYQRAMLPALRAHAASGILVSQITDAFRLFGPRAFMPKYDDAVEALRSLSLIAGRYESDSRIAANTCVILANASEGSWEKVRPMVNAGGLVFATKALLLHPRHEVARAAASVAVNFLTYAPSSAERNHFAAYAWGTGENLIKAAVDIIRAETAQRFQANSNASAHLCTMLALLGRTTVMAQRIVDAGGVDAIVGILMAKRLPFTQEEAALVTQACLALAELCAIPTTVKAVVLGGGVKALGTALTQHFHADLFTHISSALLSIRKHAC